jgi:hypothetical protein
MKFNDHRPFLFKNGVPQPLKPGIDGHQRRHNLHPVMAGAAAGVNTAGYLVQVIAHAGKLRSSAGEIEGSFPVRAGFRPGRSAASTPPAACRRSAQAAAGARPPSPTW